jgi:hypothetical protein
MAHRLDIDDVLRAWPYEPGTISVRRVRAEDGREVLQMRIEMGLLQMETAGRPDGEHPQGYDTYLEYVEDLESRTPQRFRLSVDQCGEMDREFLQYYHRRICWLALREFRHVVVDADHTLRLMDFAAQHSPSEEWSTSHERYRTFVLFHRTQAAALNELEQSRPQAALEEIASGLDRIRHVFDAIETEEPFEADAQVKQLVKLEQWLRTEYQLGPSLEEQLASAVAAEQYELAARLRDQINHRVGDESPRN